MQIVFSNYLQELRAVSINHYQKVIADATGYLYQLSSEFLEDIFKNSIALVTHWAKKQLGQKITETILTKP